MRYWLDTLVRQIIPSTQPTHAVVDHHSDRSPADINCTIPVEWWQFPAGTSCGWLWWIGSSQPSMIIDCFERWCESCFLLLLVIHIIGDYYASYSCYYHWWLFAIIHHSCNIIKPLIIAPLLSKTHTECLTCSKPIRVTPHRVPSLIYWCVSPKGAPRKGGVFLLKMLIFNDI